MTDTNNTNNDLIVDDPNDPNLLFKELNETLENFIICLSTNDSKENPQILIQDTIDKKVDELLISSKKLEQYFIDCSNKYNDEKNNIQLKQEIRQVRKEIENKDRLIEKYKNKVKEWKFHFEPLYQSQNLILHSSAQGLGGGIENQFSPVFTPMPNTPSILSNLSQSKPSPSLGLGSTIF